MSTSVWSRLAVVGLAILGIAVPARTVLAESSMSVAGTVASASEDTVYIAGYRLVITPSSTVVSDGRPISPTSIQPGTPAVAEMDDSGHLILLEAKGVVE